MDSEEQASTLKQVRVKPKLGEGTPSPSPYPVNVAFEEPMAAKLLQQKVKRYLNKKKFLTITLSDVQSEIAELKELEKGFTEFFIFMIFLITYFWALSLQMNPSLDFKVSKGLKSRMESPMFGTLMDRSYADVRSFDDALSYVESFYLENYEGTENEHECSFCVYVNEFTRARVGIGVVDLCYRLNVTVPQCEQIRSNYGDCERCAYRAAEIKTAKVDTYTPVKAEGDLNAFRAQTAERCDASVDWSSTTSAQR